MQLSYLLILVVASLAVASPIPADDGSSPWSHEATYCLSILIRLQIPTAYSRLSLSSEVVTTAIRGGSKDKALCVCEYLPLHLDVLLLRPPSRFCQRPQITLPFIRLSSKTGSIEGAKDRSCRYYRGKAGCEIDLEIASHVSFY